MPSQVALPKQPECHAHVQFIAFGRADRVSALIASLAQEPPRDDEIPLDVVPANIEPQTARDMLDTARTACGAIIVVDAGRRSVRDALRDLYVAVTVLGLRRVVAAIDEPVHALDSKQRFERAASKLLKVGVSIGVTDISAVPVVALHGDNISVPSSRMSWYGNGTLRARLNAIATDAARACKDGVLADSTNVAATGTVFQANHFEAMIAWMAEEPMVPGRTYMLQHEAGKIAVTIAAPRYMIDEQTLEHLRVRKLGALDIGVCNMYLDHSIPLDPASFSTPLRTFILEDALSHETIAIGALRFALLRSHNLRWQRLNVDKRAHATLKGHPPCIVWFTGLPAAGKSTIANLVEQRLHAWGLHTYLLDGDNIRHGLNVDLGFTQADRVENVRRVAEVAHLMLDAGLVVLVAFISPFRAERRFARSLVAPNEFCEVFVDVPLAVAEARDPKGLYAKARRRLLPNFTGIDSPYERPEHPEVSIESHRMTPEEAAQQVIDELHRMGVVRTESRLGGAHDAPPPSRLRG